MLRIVTVNWRNYEGRGVEYTNILFDMCRRNLPGGMEGSFEVFTDDRNGAYSKGITLRPLPDNLKGWWNKLYLFKGGVFPKGDRILYFDLDTVIAGRLDELASYAGPFAILRDFYRSDGLQSSVMAWEADALTSMWNRFVKFGYPMDDPGGDQAWIESHFPQDHVTILQDRFPGVFASYKADNLRNPPSTASVVVFHGHPRPHEVVSGWVPEVWKVGGLTRADLDTICNVQNEKLLANVRSAMSRELPWFDTAPEHNGHAVLVGGGPSLTDTIEELKWRQSIGQSVWAMNGSARFLADHGVTPDFYVMLDARPENRKLLHGGGPQTKYLIASQCDPSVFAALDQHDVTVWHANSDGMADHLADEKDKPVHLIGGGTTVGLNAMVLAFAQGYRKLHLYGFDSSYREDDHHAYPQALNDKDRVIDALYDGKTFKTTAWMAQQVNEFQDLVPGLVADGCIITTAGDGLLQTVARDMARDGCFTPAQLRAHSVLSRLAGTDNPRGAEIGVFVGDMSAELLRGNQFLHLIMVDSWEGSGAAYEGDSGDWHAELTDEMQERYMAAAEERVAFAQMRCDIVRGRSVNVARNVPDGSLDFVFIDADHSYQGCRADIEAWVPKLKAGGWLCGHDYENTAFPKFGVTQAVTEYLEKTGLSLELGENFTWFIRLPSHQQEH